MQNLLAFLLKYRFFFIFLILEIIAFIMIINHTMYQRYVLINSAGRLTGTIYAWNKSVAEYFSLKKTNRMLAEENSRLHETIQLLLNQHNMLIPEPKWPETSQQFTYVSARVIDNSTNKRNNYLMIDKGRLHGIKRDMAVISPEGVVGIVVNVSDNFAWVMSVLNMNTRISGRLKKTNYHGSMSWEGGDYRTGIFSDVPSHAQIETGDTIVTSGYSLIFPRDIMIGTVKEHFIGKGDHFYTVKFYFSVDYNRLSYVYVVRNLMRLEQLSIMPQP